MSYRNITFKGLLASESLCGHLWFPSKKQQSLKTDDPRQRVLPHGKLALINLKRNQVFGCFRIFAIDINHIHCRVKTLTSCQTSSKLKSGVSRLFSWLVVGHFNFSWSENSRNHSSWFLKALIPWFVKSIIFNCFPWFGLFWTSCFSNDIFHDSCHVSPWTPLWNLIFFFFLHKYDSIRALLNYSISFPIIVNSQLLLSIRNISATMAAIIHCHLQC